MNFIKKHKVAFGIIGAALLIVVNIMHIGATAKCYDGSYSYSAHRQGTCSHHHGVAEWLD
jgi:hypothetical protein